MSKNKQVRIELRFDAIEDKDIIDFIDKNGSTRAGFVKQILKMYKNHLEGAALTNTDEEMLHKARNNMSEESNDKKRKRPGNLGASLSSKDISLDD